MHPILIKAGAWLSGVSFTVWVCIALVGSLTLNVWQFGSLRSAAAEARADCLQSTLDAKAAADEQQQADQSDLTAAADAERKEVDAKLAEATQRAARAAAKLEDLIRDAPKPDPAAAPGDCYLPAEWLRTADAGVSAARAARP